MGFVGVYRAVYDYTPTGDGELEIKEGDLLYIQEKSADDDWWKAKKKAVSEDEDEPEGLIPNNYVEQVHASGKAKALYDYSRQTDEEISFSEDTLLEVFDTSDEDWTLVGLDGDYGFAPANYIEAISGASAPPPMPTRPRAESSTQPISPARSASPMEPSPAAAIAGLIQQKTGASPAPAQSARHPVQLTPEASDEEPPPMPVRPQSQISSPTPAVASSARSPSPPGIQESREPQSPGGYHLYNIHEMISHMGRNRKMPMTFGINVAKGTIMIAPEKSRDGPTQEWTAEKLTHYSIEGKHVFIELVRPSKSVDFHAGAKDTAQEIVTHLGELAGAARAEGLREVLAAGSGGGQKKGKMLYEFMAQGDDEVTVAVDDEVIILDDSQSEEWWMVKRLKNGREGVVPSSYVEITGLVPAAPVPGVDAARSYVEQNRLEDERLAREASRKTTDKSSKHRGKGSDAKTLPNPAKMRTWTDRSANFKVDAEFLGLKDGKIHLHKQNGVKIAVAVAKMSVEDLEYVEKVTGVSLDEDKPLSDIKRRSTLRSAERTSSRNQSRAGASVEPQTSRYDWFDFFLQCGVNPQVCERYTNAFTRDNMGEENLQDIDATLLRTLGLKEGDNLRVMKHLDAKFGRERKPMESQASGDNQGLFSGAGGTLRNNTRKGRPAPAVETSDTINAEAFRNGQSSPSPASAPTSSSKPGFDDNAWDVKPAAKTSEPAKAASPAPPQVAVPTGALADLSILSAPLPQPLQPTPAPPKPQAAPSQPAVSAQPSGANSAFFDQLAKQDPNPQSISAPRSRPLASQQTGGLIAPPPPNRPTSAPQTQQQSQFQPPPLQPQRTGGYVPQQLPQLAGPGQSMNEIQQRQQMQQQYQQMQAQPTGFGGQYGQQNFNQMQALQPQQTGYQPYAQQPFVNGQVNPSPFADPPRMPYQPTGFQPQQTGFQGQPTGFQQQQGFQNYQQPLQGQPTGINSFLPQPLQPQATGFGSMNGQFGQPAPSLPPMPSQNQYSLQPLTAQKTGPPPPVRFGVQEGKKLVPQPTGRANLSKATPQNPFGF